MKRILAAVLLAGLLAARAEARFERAAAAARSQALGGTFVSLADDASSLFINPAGISGARRAAWYFDYAEPAGLAGGRENRAVLEAATARTRLGAGWYRRARADGRSEDLFVVSVARKLVESTQASFLSVGAGMGLARAGFEPPCCASSARDWSNVTADFGVLLKPIPVISIGYAIGNAFGERFDAGGTGDLWRRMQRWGVSYFWEERIVVSFSGERVAGETTFHCGLTARTALPLELLAGFSEGNVTGGVRWTAAPVGATVSFASDEGRGITWMVALEMAIRRDENGEER